MVSVVRSKTELDAILSDTPNACVHFAADWCDPSKLLHNEMNTWNFPKVRLVTAMAEEMEDVTEAEGVDTIPYIIFYRDGKRAGHVEGAKVEEIKGELTKLYQTAEVIDHDARMKNLIKKEKVMLFMKGSPDAPKCGFSRTIIGILGDEGVKFGHFDILTDDTVRQGLKVLSNWPTYPQLYVDGELLGGLDVVRELQEGGELKENLE